MGRQLAPIYVTSYLNKDTFWRSTRTQPVVLLNVTFVTSLYSSKVHWIDKFNFLFIKENKMIHFNVIKSRLRILGIFDIRSPEYLVQRIINIVYRAFVLILLVIIMASSGWFVMYEAQGFGDFARIVPIIAGCIIGLASHLSFLYDKSNIVQLIDELNRLVQSSEWKSLKNKQIFIK